VPGLGRFELQPRLIFYQVKVSFDWICRDKHGSSISTAMTALIRRFLAELPASPFKVVFSGFNLVGVTERICPHMHTWKSTGL
jgi:hypothetical protein